jgi:hypothetical protein
MMHTVLMEEDGLWSGAAMFVLITYFRIEFEIAKMQAN